MPATLKFTFFGDVQLNRTLLDIEARGQDLRPAWETLADRFLVNERKQFDTEGAHASGGWAPLSPDYARWKDQHYPDKSILRRTDELYRSLTEGPQIRVIEPQAAAFGSAVDHGLFHQQGTDRMPQRRPVELADAERVQWAKVVQRYLISGGLGV